MSDFWVFGYGSLMWRPGFPFQEQQGAHLHGAHRALCVYSWVHRGTRERPGLVLGLDRGGACRGVAFRVAAADRETVLATLRERELITNVYREVWREVRLADGHRTVEALAFVVNRDHPQYAGKLPNEVLLATVRDSTGRSGPNDAYVVSTADHLRQLGIRDARLEWLAERLSSGGQAKA
jgi:cation transport protein ChaC